MRVGYARVSTQDQNPELQIDALRSAGCEELFHEKQSGKSISDRKELEQCLRMLREGDVLTVWRLDRLGRSLQDLLGIISSLEKKGVGFLSLTENIDTTSASGKLVLHIFGALSEYERSLISMRTRAGLAVAAANGRRGGRRPSMSKADVRKAVAMLGDPGITKKEVAEHFAVSRVTLNASLKRHGYA